MKNMIMKIGRWLSLLLLVFYLCLVGCAANKVEDKRLASLLPPDKELVSSLAEVAVLNTRSKILPEALREYVTLLDKRYEVVRPWLGHRVDLSLSSDGKNLVLLPYEFAYSGVDLYVTAKTSEALVRMALAAYRDGVTLQVDSGYRSMLYQRSIYVREIQAGRDLYEIAKGVAPPGYSEHMTGTVVDLVPSDWTFHGSDAEAWLAENAHKFNFVLSYQQNNKAGFLWEPWHWRYAGQVTQ